ncbi:MAG TPA: Hpt domain-containing protein [Blastocatellia bacterium]|nr:Hpt domain-containing protein [Blastocatellia bacterium]
MEHVAYLESPKQGIDRQAALELVGEDEELLAELAEIFLETLPEYLTQLREALAKSESHPLERAAHALKGSVGNFCAQRAAQAAFRLEQIGRSGDLSQAADALTVLETELKFVVSDLESLSAQATTQ